MTALREELHRVVDQLPEDELGPVLAYVRAHAHLDVPQVVGAVWDGPDFIGAFASGRSDISESGDDLLFQDQATGESPRP